jgi:hypothetical protein
MSHSIGAISRHKVLWMKKWTFNHSAERRYYIARNDTVMLREFGHYIFGLWALKSFGRCVRLCKRIALYEEMKTRKIVAVAQGWWDGVRGRMGPRPHRQRDRHGSQFQHRVVKGTHIESRSKRFFCLGPAFDERTPPGERLVDGDEQRQHMGGVADAPRAVSTPDR